MRTAELTKNYKELEGMFVKFNEASQRLEERYATLLAETEELRRQLKVKTEEARRSERLAALGEASAVIAHEIRNPLGAIQLFVSLLRTEVQGSPAGREYIDQIETSMLRLDSVISNILLFSKDKSPSFVPLNLHVLINELSEHAVLSNSDCKLSLDLKANPFLNANESGLRQVLVNLLNNAIQASTSDQKLVSISTADLGEQIEVRISNSGKAIPEELLGRMFEPFVSSKSGGTGLGLAIVKRIVEQHQAKISVSNTDHGPEFKIIFQRKQS